MFFGSGKPRIISRTTKDPIATRFGIASITPQIIAYGACQVCCLALNIHMCSNAALLDSTLPQFCIRVGNTGYGLRLTRLLLQRPFSF